MLTIIQDSQEKSPLVFPEMVGVNVIVESLFSGDYGARVDGKDIPVVIERKEIGDLFSNYAKNYNREKDKWTRAHEKGCKFILAIERTFNDVLQGHTYRKDGELHESRKSGISQIRQLMSISARYGVEVHYFQGRREMALWIQELFLSYTRLKNGAEKNSGNSTAVQIAT